ncbi:unnamed protein product [Durusdinium trenchii]|uniref:Uncharacterized protein n=1 Tax=Durusdinium trenchii TaxID=1381693 RepID=A0ABP0RQI5_9DINO
MDVDVKERRSKQKVGGPLTGRDGRGGLLAQFQTPELPKDFYSQVWAEDTAAAFRHLRKLCQDSRPKEPPQSLTYEDRAFVKWLDLSVAWTFAALAFLEEPLTAPI